MRSASWMQPDWLWGSRKVVRPVFCALMAVFVVGALAGCSGARAVEETHADFELPDDWEGEVDNAVVSVDDWCVDFGEPRLPRLVDEVLAKNLDLGIAHARVAESRALLGQARSQFFPALDAFFEVEDRYDLSGDDGWSRDYEAGVQVSYEVDLWGRIRAESEIARGELRAAELELRALEMVLAAETAETYFQLMRSREEQALIAQQIEVAETFLELTQFRHSQGIANAMDVVQQRQQIEELRELKVRAARSEALARHGLAALLGEPAQNVEMPAQSNLPALAVPGTVAVPGDLLQRRPDVFAARVRAASSHARVHAAIAERLPQIVLTPAVGVQAASLTGLLDHFFAELAGTALQHLWAGGYWQDRVAEEEAVVDRLALEFSSVLLDAVQEVEAALIDLDSRQEIMEAQRQQLTSAREALEMAQDKYRAGLLDYLRVLTALQSVQRLELAVLNSRHALLSHSVQLCRAAGGDWLRPTNQSTHETNHDDE